MNRNLFLAFALVIALSGFTSTSAAQDYNALAQCAELSPILDDIHTCMDNYLDIMDESIAGITEFLAQSLSGDALAGLDRSQQAFVEYRRQNCLWYLEFSSPRAEAEQIAKNCLANMSQQRLRELQVLVGVEDSTDQVLRGHYIYGPDRNSFQLCGENEPLWLDGDASVVSRTQQLYLSLATSEFQPLHATFAGSIERTEKAPAGHQGVLNVDTLIELRNPVESDCPLPDELVDDGSSATGQQSSALARSSDTSETEAPIQQEQVSQLRAFFGAWTVDCTEDRGNRNCKLQVDFDAASENQGSDPVSPTTLVLVRQQQSSTALEVIFPGREIDTPARIRWQVDAFSFGDIVGSDIRVDEAATRQLVPSSRFVDRDLLPMMINGAELRLEVLASVDDISGERFAATLKGLTRAVQFADEFVGESG